jgi:NAD(P)-dependent dehydrogenase (short-subunit alcohol dehydrogenase family)
VDILVSNVGIRRMQPFLDISIEDWNTVLGTNLSPAFYLARSAIPHMQRQKWGRIILISGFDGFWGHMSQRAHNVTCKAGLHGLSMALAREFGLDGITANTVVPGAIDTERDWTQYTHQPSKDEIAKLIPVGRFGAPDEVASACTYLSSDGGGFVSGQAIHVNGGHYMY